MLIDLTEYDLEEVAEPWKEYPNGHYVDFGTPSPNYSWEQALGDAGAAHQPG